MAITWANCKKALTPAGSACSDWSLFTGSGYCRVVEKTVSGVNFHLYARVHSPSPSSTAPDTVSVTMYLFARKSSTTSASYNNDKDSKVKFTFGNVSATSTLSKSRIPGSGQTVRCVGYKELTGVTVKSLSGRAFKAVFYGVPGTSDCDKTYTIEGTDMNWTYGNATLSVGKNSNTIDAKVTGITTNRYIRTSWDWSIKNNTAGNDYTISSTIAVAQDSTTTTSAYTWNNRTPGNNYTVRWRTWLRNYNPDDDASTKIAVLCSRTISVTCDKLTGKMTLSPTSSKEIKCHSSGTVKITDYHALGSISTSIANEAIATRTRPTSGTADEQCVITVYGQSVGSTTLTAKCAATTSYKEASDSVTINVVANPIASPPSPKSGLKYNGSSQTGVSGGAHWSPVSGTTGINAGSYTAKVKPAAGYAWSDGTTSEKPIPWSIAKRPGTLTLNGTEGNITKTFTYGDANSTVTVAGEGGTVSVSSNNESACIATISGSTITLNPEHAGAATITVTRAANTNYTAISRTISVTVNKAAGFATWTAANQSLKETQTYTAKVSNVHYNGVLKLKSNSDSSVASCTISGDNANIVANKLGSTTITLYVDSSADYTASPDKSFTITVRPAEVKLGTKTTPVYLGSKPVRRVYVGDKIVIF